MNEDTSKSETSEIERRLSHSIAEAEFSMEEAKGNTRSISVEPWKYKNVGDSITGWLRQINPIVNDDKGREYCRYIIDDGNQLFSVSGGVALDQCLKNPSYIGRLCRVTYQGTETLEKGRKLNKWTVEVVGDQI